MSIIINNHDKEIYQSKEIDQKNQEKIQELLATIQLIDEKFSKQQEYNQRERKLSVENTNNLVQRLEELNNELDSCYIKMGQLKNIQEENENLKEKLEKLEKEYETMMRDNKREIFELKSQVVKSRKNFLGLGVQVNVAHSKNDNISSNIESLKNENSELLLKNNELIKENENYKNVINEKKAYEAEIKELKCEIIRLKEEIFAESQIKNSEILLANSLIKNEKIDEPNNNIEKDKEGNDLNKYRKLKSIFQDLSINEIKEFCKSNETELEIEKESFLNQISAFKAIENEDKRMIVELERTNFKLKEDIYNQNLEILNLKTLIENYATQITCLEKINGEVENKYKECTLMCHQISQKIEKKDFKTNKFLECCSSKKGDCQIF